MEIRNLPFSLVDFNSVQGEEHPGDAGTSLWRMVNVPGVRFRIVDYSPRFLADHWCDKGHFVYVLEGSFTLELKDGRSFEIPQNTGFVISDDAEPHKSRSENGAKLLIID